MLYVQHHYENPYHILSVLQTEAKIKYTKQLWCSQQNSQSRNLFYSPSLYLSLSIKYISLSPALNLNSSLSSLLSIYLFAIPPRYVYASPSVIFPLSLSWKLSLFLFFSLLHFPFTPLLSMSLILSSLSHILILLSLFLFLSFRSEDSVATLLWLWLRINTWSLPTVTERVDADCPSCTLNSHIPGLFYISMNTTGPNINHTFLLLKTKQKVSS